MAKLITWYFPYSLFSVQDHGIQRIVRKCGYQKHAKKNCYEQQDKDHSEVVCQCFKDGCNGSGEQVPGVLPGLLAALFSVAQLGILKLV